MREACEAGMTAAVAWPLEQQAARGLVGFVCDTALPIAEIREGMWERVPGMGQTPPGKVACVAVFSGFLWVLQAPLEHRTLK